MYNDKHAVVEINEISDSTTNKKIGNKPQTMAKTCKIKLIKITHFGATAGSVENLATQQKNVKRTVLWQIKIKHIMVQPMYKQ